MHITGGVGSFANDEQFGGDYVLPNDGYLETCAAVGAGFFHHNMNLAFGDARFVDELERALYNGVLSGVSLEGDTYFYENPLESGEGRARWSWHALPLLPADVPEDDVGAPRLHLRDRRRGALRQPVRRQPGAARAQGVAVEVVQRTGYPWEGGVEVELRPEGPVEMTLAVRVPGWAEGAAFSLNGDASRARLGRAWLRSASAASGAGAIASG